VKCPVCPDSVLAISERQGVEIDYCPICRGVWLDRGELDKLIAAAGRSSERPRDDRRYDRRDDDWDDDRRPYQQPHYPHHPMHGSKYKKKKSILGEIFDF
jgi:Zn-finger nucleic acid-binding protein